MKNKLYNLINGGLLSMAAILVGMSMMVAGCSGSDTVAGGDLNEAVESSSSEEESSSSVEAQSSSDFVRYCSSSQAWSSSSQEKSNGGKKDGDTEAAKMSSSSEESSSSSVEAQSSSSFVMYCSSSQIWSSSSVEYKYVATSSSSETVKAGSSSAKETSSSSVEIPSSSSVKETSSSSEKIEEQSSSSEGSKKVSKPFGSDPNCNANYTREWRDLCDTLHNYIIFEKTLATLGDDKYVIVDRGETEYSVDQFSMETYDFRQTFEYRKNWLQDLVDEGVVWDGGEWDETDEQSGLKVHYIARADTILEAYQNRRTYLRVIYHVSYVVESEPNVTHYFDFDIPVRYRCNEFEFCKGNF